MEQHAAPTVAHHHCHIARRTWTRIQHLYRCFRHFGDFADGIIPREQFQTYAPTEAFAHTLERSVFAGNHTAAHFGEEAVIFDLQPCRIEQPHVPPQFEIPCRHLHHIRAVSTGGLVHMRQQRGFVLNAHLVMGFFDGVLQGTFAFGQVDLLLAALGFLLLPGLFLGDGQRADPLLVDRIRLGDALLGIVLLRRGRVLRPRLGNRLRRRQGVFRNRLGLHVRYRLGQRRQFFRGTQRTACGGGFGRRQLQARLHHRVARGSLGAARRRPHPGDDEHQRDQHVHQQRQYDGHAPFVAGVARRRQSVSVHRSPGPPSRSSRP